VKHLQASALRSVATPSAFLQEIFPNIQTLALDPIHLAIVYEYATWRKRTDGSCMLRQCMSKFTAFDETRIAEL
jgi:hypothetical protein